MATTISAHLGNGWFVEWNLAGIHGTTTRKETMTFTSEVGARTPTQITLEADSIARLRKFFAEN